LQSTNEELETTNEELQSTNEELETTNEELHSLNEELETTNDELEMRTRELDEINRRYAETLEHMPSPVTLVGDDERITLWNSAAQKLFGLEAKVAVGLHLQQMPLPNQLRSALVRRVKAVLAKQRSASVRFKKFRSGSFNGDLKVHCGLVSNPSMRAVLVIFDPIPGSRQENSSPKSRGKKKSAAKKTGSKGSSPRKRN
jgi:two-component system CheB/CheR fusion protein